MLQQFQLEPDRPQILPQQELRILKGKLISLAFGLRGGNGKLCSAGVIRGATEFALSNFFICHPDHLARKSRRFQRLRANAFTGSIHAASTCNKSPFRPYRNGSRSEEHTSELQSLMRSSYAVYCL